ncbi:DNA ligase [Undibacterium sp. 5I1]|uniref:DNA ligase n=1 Tax=unclassified Undibacterium TaxID=2630295 RepID=UPI002AB4DA20|nr:MULTISPECIES: DNA ligase [unclassified Undibacterium]MDY7539790.1 DNA ligase [Undibacterium sp. 5I1]MEB0232046.1 DNA ligase [Undibacterium sp. 10I3]MEB0256826.1 DNA ligase [Undibacterium sp. 5I1]
MNPSQLPPLRRVMALLLLSGVLQPFAQTSAADHMTASTDSGAARMDILLAQNFSDKFDPALYLVSEKLDGVRALWDGKQLRFRSGKAIHAPAWFIAALPKHTVDGELWMERHSFDRLSAAVQRQEPVDAEWQKISYQLYELPNGEGDFAQRYASLQASVAQAGVAWLQVLPQVRVADKAALQQKLNQVVRDGGEGLMLHRADAPWQTGRSDVLLKLKPQLDAEAVVVSHEPGKGKYQGMLGALVLQTPEGVRFRLGTGFSDEQRRNPPAVGSTVTYRYRDVTSTGLPKFASFLRVRQPE